MVDGPLELCEFFRFLCGHVGQKHQNPLGVSECPHTRFERGALAVSVVTVEDGENPRGKVTRLCCQPPLQCKPSNPGFTPQNHRDAPIGNAQGMLQNSSQQDMALPGG
ncbi:hypothetical protein MHY01S_04750 [Meiothermus hypogaeus NBRC 106114]|uniref:Uncharacterized protein n=1 Tax=Meiothermus hypogaeus NBRC 106114 TaxID=1227553 RepID=A0A511QY62_9DEIN|nr:hypothetical protein MHY01S_04750 [Meiothermus hypogaeus NBRC 106114]